jgi:WD40 repeat protein
MGTCASKEQPRSHERLNEFDQKYFTRLEARRVLGSRGGRWRTTNVINHGTLSSRIEENALEDTPTLLPAQPWTLSSSEGERSPSTQDDCEAAPSAFTVTGTTPSSSSSGLLAFSSQVSTSTEDGHESDWRVSRQGHALQLRLAKHRCLQLAVTKQSSPTGSPVSPVTMDSTFGETPSSQYSGLNDQRIFSSDCIQSSILKSKTELVDGDSTTFCDVPSVDFDAMQAIIWKEIARDHKVTALAMSQTTNSTPSFHTDPLMMAMGDESGKVVVSQIVDQAVSSANLPGDSSRPDSQLDLLPNQALEFSVDERVRSLDFSKGAYLAVGGDGCTAWILEVIFDGEKNRRLKNLVAIHKVQRVDRVYAVRFSPDNRYLAVGGFDGKTALVPMEEIYKDKKLENMTGDRNDDDSLLEIMESSIIELDRSGLIYCLDWSPAGDYLAVAGSTKSCAIYGTRGFDLVHETECRSTAIQALQWNPSGTFLAIGGRDVAIIEGKAPFNIHCEINHAPTDSPIKEFRYRINSLCWSPSGSYLAIAGADGICLVVETNGYTLVHELRRTVSITALAWGQQKNLNGDVRRYLALSDEDFNVALVKAGAEARAYETADDLSSVASSSHFSSASDWVLREDTFRDLEDVEPQKIPSGLKSQGNNVTAVAFSKRGKSKTSSYLAFACDDCSLTILTTRDWKAVFVSHLRVHHGAVLRLIGRCALTNFLCILAAN